MDPGHGRRYYPYWPRLTALHVEQANELESMSFEESYSPESAGAIYRYYLHPDDIVTRRNISMYSIHDHDEGTSSGKASPCRLCFGALLLMSFGAAIAVAVVLAVIMSQPYQVFQTPTDNITSLNESFLAQKEDMLEKNICKLMDVIFDIKGSSHINRKLDKCDISLLKRKDFMFVTFTVQVDDKFIEEEADDILTTVFSNTINLKDKLLTRSRASELLNKNITTAKIVQPSKTSSTERDASTSITTTPSETLPGGQQPSSVFFGDINDFSFLNNPGHLFPLDILLVNTELYHQGISSTSVATSAAYQDLISPNVSKNVRTSSIHLESTTEEFETSSISPEFFNDYSTSTSFSLAPYVESNDTQPVADEGTQNVRDEFSFTINVNTSTSKTLAPLRSKVSTLISSFDYSHEQSTSTDTEPTQLLVYSTNERKKGTEALNTPLILKTSLSVGTKYRMDTSSLPLVLQDTVNTLSIAKSIETSTATLIISPLQVVPSIAKSNVVFDSIIPQRLLTSREFYFQNIVPVVSNVVDTKVLAVQNSSTYTQIHSNESLVRPVKSSLISFSGVMQNTSTQSNLQKNERTQIYFTQIQHDHYQTHQKRSSAEISKSFLQSTSTTSQSVSMIDPTRSQSIYVNKESTDATTYMTYVKDALSSIFVSSIEDNYIHVQPSSALDIANTDSSHFTEPLPTSHIQVSKAVLTSDSEKLTKEGVNYTRKKSAFDAEMLKTELVGSILEEVSLPRYVLGISTNNSLAKRFDRSFMAIQNVQDTLSHGESKFISERQMVSSLQKKASSTNVFTEADFGFFVKNTHISSHVSPLSTPRIPKKLGASNYEELESSSPINALNDLEHYLLQTISTTEIKASESLSTTATPSYLTPISTATLMVSGSKGQRSRPLILPLFDKNQDSPNDSNTATVTNAVLPNALSTTDGAVLGDIFNTPQPITKAPMTFSPEVTIQLHAHIPDNLLVRKDLQKVSMIKINLKQPEMNFSISTTLPQYDKTVTARSILIPSIESNPRVSHHTSDILVPAGGEYKKSSDLFEKTRANSQRRSTTVQPLLNSVFNFHGFATHVSDGDINPKTLVSGNSKTSVFPPTVKSTSLNTATMKSKSLLNKGSKVKSNAPMVSEQYRHTVKLAKVGNFYETVQGISQPGSTTLEPNLTSIFDFNGLDSFVPNNDFNIKTIGPKVTYTQPPMSKSEDKEKSIFNTSGRTPGRKTKPLTNKANNTSNTTPGPVMNSEFRFGVVRLNSTKPVQTTPTSRLHKAQTLKPIYPNDNEEQQSLPLLLSSTRYVPQDSNSVLSTGKLDPHTATTSQAISLTVSTTPRPDVTPVFDFHGFDSDIHNNDPGTENPKISESLRSASPMNNRGGIENEISATSEDTIGLKTDSFISEANEITTTVESLLDTNLGLNTLFSIGALQLNSVDPSRTTPADRVLNTKSLETITPATFTSQPIVTPFFDFQGFDSIIRENNRNVEKHEIGKLVTSNSAIQSGEATDTSESTPTSKPVSSKSNKISFSTSMSEASMDSNVGFGRPNTLFPVGAIRLKSANSVQTTPGTRLLNKQTVTKLLTDKRSSQLLTPVMSIKKQIPRKIKTPATEPGTPQTETSRSSFTLNPLTDIDFSLRGLNTVLPVNSLNARDEISDLSVTGSVMDNVLSTNDVNVKSESNKQSTSAVSTTPKNRMPLHFGLKGLNTLTPIDSLNLNRPTSADTINIKPTAGWIKSQNSTLLPPNHGSQGLAQGSSNIHIRRNFGLRGLNTSFKALKLSGVNGDDVIQQTTTMRHNPSAESTKLANQLQISAQKSGSNFGQFLFDVANLGSNFLGMNNLNTIRITDNEV